MNKYFLRMLPYQIQSSVPENDLEYPYFGFGVSELTKYMSSQSKRINSKRWTDRQTIAKHHQIHIYKFTNLYTSRCCAVGKFSEPGPLGFIEILFHAVTDKDTSNKSKSIHPAEINWEVP